MKNKTYIEPAIEFSFFNWLDVMLASNGADFDIGDLLGEEGGPL